MRRGGPQAPVEQPVSGGLRVVWRALRGEIRNPPWALQVKSLPARGKISLPFEREIKGKPRETHTYKRG